MLRELIEELYAHTTMTMDDIMYFADKNGITIDPSVKDKITGKKDDDEVTFDVVAFDDGTIFIFDI